jgi:hypothetical protein
LAARTGDLRGLSAHPLDRGQRCPCQQPCAEARQHHRHRATDQQPGRHPGHGLVHRVQGDPRDHHRSAGVGGGYRQQEHRRLAAGHAALHDQLRAASPGQLGPAERRLPGSRARGIQQGIGRADDLD